MNQGFLSWFENGSVALNYRPVCKGGVQPRWEVQMLMPAWGQWQGRRWSIVRSWQAAELMSHENRTGMKMSLRIKLMSFRDWTRGLGERLGQEELQLISITSSCCQAPTNSFIVNYQLCTSETFSVHLSQASSSKANSSTKPLTIIFSSPACYSPLCNSCESK